MPRNGRPPNPHRPVTLAIDFDRTFTPDPYLWQWFIEKALKRKHRVLAITGRADDEANRSLLRNALGPDLTSVEIICLSHQPKRAALKARGIYVDIWIDDLPETITAKSRDELGLVYDTFPTTETHGPYAQ